ncbi:hypothetical protein [uncultured Sphingomonas sp.]|uniref:hypothetical protein n=1 Tax=uncultured Sphingomonas sp. TaxID=158754 RepID=UPI0025E742F5|nr:hypothetical protein [uncultured Sphingomonas sp.]
MSARFRIKPGCVEEVLAMLAQAGISPQRVYDRPDGEVAVEIGDISDAQGQFLALNFKHKWSAIIGIVGGDPFETRH